MLFQEAPADTVRFMIAGYAVGITVMTIFIASLFVRWNNLKREIESLEEIARTSK